MSRKNKNIDSDEEIMQLHSVRTSCRIANTEKRKAFQNVDYFVKELKNEMSKYIYNNFQLMLDDYDEFIRSYNKFNNDFISAWETQAIFQDICKSYNNTLKQKRKQLDTSIQFGYRITKYKRKTTLKRGIVKERGDVKEFKIKKQWTDLTKITKLLTFLDCDNLEKYKGQDIYTVILFWQKHKHWNKILKVAKQLSYCIKERINLIEYTTGTYRKLLNGKEFIFDETNGKYQYWFYHKNHYYPLQLEFKNYHLDLNKLIKDKNKQVFVKVIDDRIDFIFTTEYSPIFKEFDKVIALDINIKHNFCTSSNRDTRDYNRGYIQEFITEIKKIDEIGYKNITNEQRKHLSSIVGKNEWYFKKLISEILDDFEREGITDIVMEDLQTNNFKYSIVSSNEFKQRYTRLIRLLRLGSISKWMKGQGEKRGIRVHLTTPAYSSQECSDCHYIDRDNRPTQELFHCVKCNHENEADFESPINLLKRFTSDVLKEKLHTLDKFGRMIPKKLRKETVKEILSSFCSV